MLDPIKTTTEIKDAYLKYLLTAYPINNANLKAQFKEQLELPEAFIKGPFLEATPSYKKGSSIRNLIEQGTLSPLFASRLNQGIPQDRQLYIHQEQAIHKVVKQNRNVVVATGTGSGKTESFLIPIINYLFREIEQGTLVPGVRALLLYPMNALANDQVKRLRLLLANSPEITFGRYTGETLENKKRAEDQFHRTFVGQTRLTNELLSREEIRQTPPHILLTNYSMLEYLLLRPDDFELLDGSKAKFWKFIVLDEAHTYDGAKGIEIGMLLRRFKERVARSGANNIKCIATSATVGSGTNVYPQICSFASKLFDASFKWNDTDSDEQDVIIAEREKLDTSEPCWGKGNINLYSGLVEVIRHSNERWKESILDLCARNGIDKKFLDKLSQDSEFIKSPSSLIYHILKKDDNVRNIRELLSTKPYSVSEITSVIFSDIDENTGQQTLTTLVELCSKVKPSENSHSLLSARYHLFVRATEGAYVSFHPENKFFMHGRKKISHNDMNVPVHELASCRRCGALYLVGTIDDNNVFQQCESFDDEGNEKADYYLLDEETIEPSFLMQNNLNKDQSQAIWDEDELVASGEENSNDTKPKLKLCRSCGLISSNPKCSCSDKKYIVLTLASKNGQPKGCIGCGIKGTITVGRFLTGQDAPVSVLTSALYQNLPDEPNELNLVNAENEDDWSTGAIANSSHGRQLLLFSDSRQDAAYFSCFLNRTYQNILHRRLIVKILQENSSRIVEDKWTIGDLVEHLKNEAVRVGMFSNEHSPTERKGLAWTWLLQELIEQDRNLRLEGLGILGFKLQKPETWKAPKPIIDELNLTEHEAWLLYQILIDSLRLNGAITLPNEIINLDAFAPKKLPYRVCSVKSSPKDRIFAWNPALHSSNRRYDFLSKLIRQAGADESKTRELLEKIWEKTLVKPDTILSKEFFEVENTSGTGNVYRIKHQPWQLVPGLIDSSISWYRCDHCGHLFHHNLRNICPTFRCEGKLKECRPENELKDNHYYQLYQTIRPIPLTVEEHTAQIESDTATKLQEKFIRKEVNILSCSTTFELGVDVGELQAVLMRNVPPTTANYIQRAGRAGRRVDSVAFVLTFARRRPHDLAFFQDPASMIAGKIRPPHFEILNEKIIKRHINATALSAFWVSLQYKHFYGTAQSFFLTEGKNGTTCFKEYLSEKPKELLEALRHIVPPEMLDTLKIEDWGWTKDVFSGTLGSLTLAQEELLDTKVMLDNVLKELQSQGKKSDRILGLIQTITRRQIIDFLSSQSVIPKYGFPVDVVNLKIECNDDAATKIKLDRDLRIALSEYAPGSEVVANGKLWKSTRIKKLTTKEWRRYKYYLCNHCKMYYRYLIDDKRINLQCKGCTDSLANAKVKGEFLIPEFGFVCDEKSREPGDSKPAKTYSSSVFYTGEHESNGNDVKISTTNGMVKVTALHNAQMAIINRAGFSICRLCGYASNGDSKKKTHKVNGFSKKECSGKLTRTDLGYEFKTDVLMTQFANFKFNLVSQDNLWYSLLYALLEGASDALNVARSDLSGCLYFVEKNERAIILYDDVPGGAGHVNRLAADPDLFREALAMSCAKVDGRCGCSEETSCYGCLRNFRNQNLHDILARGPVLQFLTEFLGKY